MICPKCNSSNIIKQGFTTTKKQKHKCKNCGKLFVENPIKPLEECSRPIIRKRMLEKHENHKNLSMGMIVGNVVMRELVIKLISITKMGIKKIIKKKIWKYCVLNVIKLKFKGKPKQKITCDNCSNEFERWCANIRNHNFCKRKCYNEWQTGRKKIRNLNPKIK